LIKGEGECCVAEGTMRDYLPLIKVVSRRHAIRRAHAPRCSRSANQGELVGKEICQGVEAFPWGAFFGGVSEC